MKDSSKKNLKIFNLEGWFRFLLVILPMVLFFSYYPVISFGKDEAMNFELSLPLIWLVLFDILVLTMMVREKTLFKDWKKKWVWVFFPAWLTVSVFWSQNCIRGFLTVGILWLIYLAVDGMWSFRKVLDGEFRAKWWKWFFGFTLVICGWCLLQCILDLVGINREYTLMCEGCTYRVFGFPHPNGFAIEPQFMGNLLLAPVLVAMWLLFFKKRDLKKKSSAGMMIGLFAMLTTLFLTFSRGAIYALVLALIVMSVLVVVRGKKERRNLVRQVGVAWVMAVFAFVVALNCQGLMAAVSSTNDTYGTGVAKVLNHLSLGVIDIDGKKDDDWSGKTQASELQENRGESVEKPVENYKDNEAIFDGYAEESTNVRLMISSAGLETWRQELKTVLFGVGLGGAGQALYQNGLTSTPKEIVQNQFVSLLLETGLVGILLLILTIYLILKLVVRSNYLVLMMSLILAYSVTLCFFAGLANALHIYLLPVIIDLVIDKNR